MIAEPNYSLHQAVIQNDSDRVAALVNKAATDIDELNSYNWTALHLSSQLNLSEITDILLTANANTKICNANGVSPLHCAVWADAKHVTSKLLNNGANPNIKDDTGLTPLTLAAWNNNVQCIRELIKFGAIINSRTPDGSSTLHYAVWNNSVAAIAELIELGALVNARNDDGLTPYELGKKILLTDVADYFISLRGEVKLQFDEKHVAAAMINHIPEINDAMYTSALEPNQPTTPTHNYSSGAEQPLRFSKDADSEHNDLPIDITPIFDNGHTAATAATAATSNTENDANKATDSNNLQATANPSSSGNAPAIDVTTKDFASASASGSLPTIAPAAKSNTGVSTELFTSKEPLQHHQTNTENLATPSPQADAMNRENEEEHVNTAFRHKLPNDETQQAFITPDTPLIYPEQLIHTTFAGDKVRRASELVIANLLFSLGISYTYERKITGIHALGEMHPTFTVITPKGSVLLWEHFPQHNSKEDNQAAIAWYVRNGFSANENLFISYTATHHGINSKKLLEVANALIDRIDEDSPEGAE